MANKSPFDLDEGIENIPIVKAPVQGINKVANSGTKYAVKQAKALTKAFVSQLYGSSTGTAVTATDDDQQQADAAAADPLAHAKKAQANAAAGAATMPQAAKPHGATSTSSTTPTATTPEEEELAATRRALHQHINEYQVPTFGKIDDLEMDMRKEAQKRKQEEEKRKEEVEEEKKQLEELEVKKKKAAPPMAVQMGRNRTEMHRGSSG